jgi:uncharacterized protein (DUF983 family)
MANSRLLAIARQRCPKCLEGKVFCSFLGTHTHCPFCRIRYARESGYYLNAMFIAYVLGFLLVAPTAFYLYVKAVPVNLFFCIMAVVLLICWPLIFRYSRVLWLHLDQLLDPRLNEEPSVQGENPLSRH